MYKLELVVVFISGLLWGLNKTYIDQALNIIFSM